jgi:type I restriction enzyme S subunit
MSFPRYERYKNIGVEWLGEVPEHWSIRRMKTLFEIKKRIAGDTGYDVLSITQSGIKIKDTESNEGQVAMDYAKYQFVYPGDFAMNHMDLLTGYIDISKVEGVTSPDYRVFSVRDATACHPSYFLRLFQSAYHQKIFYAFGQGASQFGRWRLPTEAFNEFALPYPPLPEQALLSGFLDRETAKIDALIEEQRRLIELLKEKRLAVISHAVTKGLHAIARMKHSDIEWIGDVPEHWRVGRCGFYLSIVSGFAFPSDQFSHDESDTRLLRGINVGVGRIRWDETVYWRRLPHDGLDDYEMHEGDLILGMDRPLIGGGVRVAKLGASDTPSLLLQRVICLKVGPSLDSGYLLALLSSEMFIAHFAPETTGVSVPHISPEQVANFMIPLPPLQEQNLIAAHIHAEVKKSEELTSTVDYLIQLLQERRSALISAAVTGKIDVRNYTPKEAA